VKGGGVLSGDAIVLSGPPFYIIDEALRVFGLEELLKCVAEEG